MLNKLCSQSVHDALGLVALRVVPASNAALFPCVSVSVRVRASYISIAHTSKSHPRPPKTTQAMGTGSGCKMCALLIPKTRVQSPECTPDNQVNADKHSALREQERRREREEKQVRVL